MRDSEARQAHSTFGASRVVAAAGRNLPGAQKRTKQAGVTHARRIFFFLPLLVCLVGWAPAKEPPAGRDVRALVPAGRAARWKVIRVNFDRQGCPSYEVLRRGTTHGELEALHVFGTPRGREIPSAVAEDQIRRAYIPALGRWLRYYLAIPGDGADNDVYRTESVACSDGFGGTLHVYIEAEAVKTPPAKLLGDVRWVPPGTLRSWNEK